MIEESLVLRDSIHLYTSLLGRKRSLRTILKKLRELVIPSVGSTVLYQGKTCRWCVCWSFDERFQTAFDEHPWKYKVFGRKKLAQQRYDVGFHIAVEEEKEVWKRAEAFCHACEGIEMTREEDGKGIYRVHQFVYHFPDGSTEQREEMNNDKGNEEVSFSMEVEEEEGEEEGCMVCFHILVGLNEIE